MPLSNHLVFGDYNQLQLEEGVAAEEADRHHKWGLKSFLESWDLSDIFFIVGPEERPVPAHKAILAASGNFPLCSSSSFAAITLPTLSYPLLRALLHYIYTGWTQVQLQLLSSYYLCISY